VPGTQISCITPDNLFSSFHVGRFVERDSWPLVSLTGTEVHEWTVETRSRDYRDRQPTWLDHQLDLSACVRCLIGGLHCVVISHCKTPTEWQL